MDGTEQPGGSSERESDAVDQLRACAQRRLNRIRRIFFTSGQAIDREQGAVELTFDGIPPMVLDVGGDGEALVVHMGPWLDPFVSPLSEENQQWIATHGKWDVVDVSQEPDYFEFVGATLHGLWLLRTELGKVCGTRLQFGSKSLDIVCNGDEVFVYTLPDDAKLAKGKVFASEQIVSEFKRGQTSD